VARKGKNKGCESMEENVKGIWEEMRGRGREKSLVVEGER
jgi:hypothetical protein